MTEEDEFALVLEVMCAAGIVLAIAVAVMEIY